MAAGAAQTLAIRRELLADDGMKKRRFFLGVVTFYTAFFRASVSHLMAIAANVAHFGTAFIQLRRSLQIMTEYAFLIAMTILTGELEKLDMFHVLKGHHRKRILRRKIRLYDRHHDYRNTYRIRGFALAPFAGYFRGVTKTAFGFVAPFPMARQALSMICHFKTGSGQIGKRGIPIVAFPTRRDSTPRAVVMTNPAFVTHFRHFGMQLMSKWNGLV